jgi:hypothetical protein
MFSLAYVLLPFSDTPPAEAIAASLARFQRGRPGDVPDDWIAFHDETQHVRKMHEATYTFEIDQGLKSRGGDIWFLDTHVIRQEMDRRGLTEWTVRFADSESNLERFGERFVRSMERHPVTGGFGQWLNGLGRWDWWDLGGRFDGVITGAGRHPGRTRSVISSGPSRGRAVLSNIEDALVAALDQEPPDEVDVSTDKNIELVETLIEQIDTGEVKHWPGAVVLPPESVDDRLRWVRNWPKIEPAEALAFLGCSPDAEWPEIVRASCCRFQDHWAAGVAFHH